MHSDLIAKYPVISDQVSKEDIALVLQSLESVLDKQIPGDVVELGCYIGTTSLFIQRLLDEHPNGAGRTFHAYDSFAGLPEKSIADASVAGTSFKAGELTVSKKQFVREFKRAQVRLPIVHKAWFNELSASDIPEHVAFAFLDGDFYDSILSSLKLVWPRMTPGGLVLIDDYGREALPGVERAVRDFFQHRTLPPLRVAHNIAILKVPTI
ncbi:MAG TPA: TylF/MycF/NovP-related O-methyltransferase [Candidatus Saccharimonadales bacterium]|nr:TylF/MycF/NovP-related O-methyltransferase [Candidatus Saccharimonadales bacterium]